MMGRWDDEVHEDEEWEEDPEGLQARDLVDEDDDETPTVECPHCGREIPDFVDRCAYCGAWVIQGESARQRSPWMIIAALLALGAFLAWYVF